MGAARPRSEHAAKGRADGSEAAAERRRLAGLEALVLGADPAHVGAPRAGQRVVVLSGERFDTDEIAVGVGEKRRGPLLGAAQAELGEGGADVVVDLSPPVGPLASSAAWRSATTAEETATPLTWRSMATRSTVNSSTVSRSVSIRPRSLRIASPAAAWSSRTTVRCVVRSARDGEGKGGSWGRAGKRMASAYVRVRIRTAAQDWGQGVTRPASTSSRRTGRATRRSLAPSAWRGR